MTIITKKSARKLILIVGLLFYSALSGQNLNDYKWKHRVLIVQSKEQSPKFQNQMHEFKNSLKDLKERQLIIVQVVGVTYKILDYSNNNANTSWKPLDEVTNKINTKNEFSVVLIGLDGGKKLKKKDIITKKELFGRIDLMPMRRQELKDN